MISLARMRTPFFFPLALLVVAASGGAITGVDVQAEEPAVHGDGTDGPYESYYDAAPYDDGFDAAGESEMVPGEFRSPDAEGDVVGRETGEETGEVSFLPWARLPLDDASMGAVSERAGELVRSGFGLGQRGAYYSARGEFIQALRLIAQSLDVKSSTDLHSKALAAGLRAMQEADDFVPRRPAVEADVDVPSLVASHRTPILKDVPGLEQLGVFGAIRSYYTYSQEQLAAAANHEPAGSMALYGLARVRTALAANEASRHLTSEPAAICLHQAALMVRPDNFMAANELGVLLARHGRYEDAKQVLRHSVETAPSREGLHNLAVIYGRLGQPQLSAALQNQVDALNRRTASHQGPSTDDRVIWLDAEAFARTGYQPGVEQPVVERAAEENEARERRSATPSGRRTWPWR
jgi:tetratricopeptide (TPR) repeat protein